MDLEIELLTGELRLFRNTIMKLTSRFKHIERFLVSEFGSKYEHYEGNQDGNGFGDDSMHMKRNTRKQASALSEFTSIISDEKVCSDSDISDSGSEAESFGDHVQNSENADKERLGNTETSLTETGERTPAVMITGARKRGRPRKNPRQDTPRSDVKRPRPPFVKWILYKTFSDEDEAEAYVISEEQIWSKSFMNKSQQGKKQYFGCRVSRRCPARRALFYRNDGTYLLYKSECGHDHSGVNASRLKRFANILSYAEIEDSILRSTPPPQSAEQVDHSGLNITSKEADSNSTVQDITHEESIRTEATINTQENTSLTVCDSLTK